MVSRTAAGASGLFAALLGGCTLITDSFLTNDFSGDPFPIDVDTSSGAVLVGMRPGGQADRRAVLDLLSPFTLDDPGTNTEPSLSFVDLTLLGKNPDGTLTVPRARFLDAQLLSLHPCEIPKGADPKNVPPCSIGTAADPRPFDAVIGADVLAGDAVRLRLGDDRIFVLPDVAGSDPDRTLACDAVFDSPYRGGGTLVIAGTELAFGNRRITLRACLRGPDPDDPDQDPQLAPTDDLGNFPEPLREGSPTTRCTREQSRWMIWDALDQRGTDALFVVSTSIGISILGRAAYERYVLAHPSAPAFDALPPDAVYLPSGLVDGRRATIDRIALVGAGAANALAPCRQLYVHRVMSALGPIDASEFDPCPIEDPATKKRMYEFASPCNNGDAFCATPGILELTPAAGIDVLVVDDADPTLQALRTELRPDQPEVDGILGTNILRNAEIDADYPHDRLLARCPGDSCIVRPALAQAEDRCQINRCITGVKIEGSFGCKRLTPPG